MVKLDTLDLQAAKRATNLLCECRTLGLGVPFLSPSEANKCKAHRVSMLTSIGAVERRARRTTKTKRRVEGSGGGSEKNTTAVRSTPRRIMVFRTSNQGKRVQSAGVVSRHVPTPRTTHRPIPIGGATRLAEGWSTLRRPEDPKTRYLYFTTNSHTPTDNDQLRSTMLGKLLAAAAPDGKQKATPRTRQRYLIVSILSGLGCPSRARRSLFLPSRIREKQKQTPPQFGFKTFINVRAPTRQVQSAQSAWCLSSPRLP